MSLDTQEYRRALACFPTGVTVVTAVGRRNEIIGINASSFSSVSLDQPLVLFSLNRNAHSLAAFLSSQHFAVNVLRRTRNQFPISSRRRWAKSGKVSNTSPGTAVARS